MWVDGVVRVVCGLSEETSCQDVVIALAQAIGECLQVFTINMTFFISHECPNCTSMSTCFRIDNVVFNGILNTDKSADVLFCSLLPELC